MKTKITVLTLFFLLTFFSAFAQNPQVVNGVATYTSNINIGPKFSVPNTWNKIVINAGVTITGSFYMPTRTTPIEIMGMNRKTSIIQGDGSRPTDDGMNGRSYSAIRADKSPDVYIHGLTITKPMKFHIHGGFGNVTVERCDIIAGSETHTTDGIHGGVGKTVIKDCYIDVYDDALYTIECTLVENTTIVHNKNGGPFMTSWGASVPSNHICIVRNCTVIANSSTDYHHGVFSWAQKHDDIAQTMHVKIEGTFNYIVNSGKNPAPMYTIGRIGNLTGIKNATLKIDGLCLNTNSIDIRENATSNKVVFVNCGTSNNYIFIDHNASGLRLRGNATNTVSTQSGGTGDWVQWQQQATSDGYFYLLHKATGKKLQGNSTYAVSLVDATNNGSWEQWKWIDAGDGWYRLENRGHNRWLHVNADGITNWTIGPKTWTNNNTKWKYSSTTATVAAKSPSIGNFDNKEQDDTIIAQQINASNNLTIRGLQKGAKVSIYNTKGQMVYSTTAQNTEIELSACTLAFGIHIIKTQVNNKIVSKKIIIQ